MTPLPPPLGNGDVVGWRMDLSQHKSTWDSGEGAYRAGGRWNSKGVRAVYCSLDPSTAILEVAVHKGFRALDMVPHVLTCFAVSAPAALFIVKPQDVPNSNWLCPGTVSAGQQQFGDALLNQHKMFLVPSTVSTRSWNLIFLAPDAGGMYSLLAQDDFALDPRLHPATPP